MSELPPVVVTGVGPISAIGCDRNEFFSALMAGRCGIRPLTLCNAEASPSRIAAEVVDFRLERYIQNGRVMARHLARPTQLALGASVLALHDAQIDLDACEPDRLGVFVGTSVANMEDISGGVRRCANGELLSPNSAFSLFNHSTACVLSSFFNIQGPIHTTSTGCNSGLDALGHAVRMIQTGDVDVMLVVGTDCEVVSEVLMALNASGSLSSGYNDEPHRASRPFELSRDGSVIGEGAAALVLESEPAARARRARIYARVAGFKVCAAGRNRQYAHNRPELDVDPFVRAITGTLRQADWTQGSVDLVSANGSSSVLYDRLEALALAEVFGSLLPETPVHSIKSMLGQHGAGSSGLQSIAACLSIRRSLVPPTINHDEPDPECGQIQVVTDALIMPVERVLVNAIGLGGFYYSVGAFEACESSAASASGVVRSNWSAQHAPRFQPTEEFHAPIEPWAPRTG
jgi:3-oxoacyl-[acyl-carrier-protein] synthase II